MIPLQTLLVIYTIHTCSHVQEDFRAHMGQGPVQQMAVMQHFWITAAIEMQIIVRVRSHNSESVRIPAIIKEVVKKNSRYLRGVIMTHSLNANIHFQQCNRPTFS